MYLLLPLPLVVIKKPRLSIRSEEKSPKKLEFLFLLVILKNMEEQISRSLVLNILALPAKPIADVFFHEKKRHACYDVIKPMHQHKTIRLLLRSLFILALLIGTWGVYTAIKIQKEIPELTIEETSSNFCDEMTQDEAQALAEASLDCQEVGNFAFDQTEQNFCNQNTHTWQFVLDNVTHDGCGAACIVSTQTKEVSVQWMCTGLIQQ